jgi:hypothetical protein
VKRNGLDWYRDVSCDWMSECLNKGFRLRFLLTPKLVFVVLWSFEWIRVRISFSFVQYKRLGIAQMMTNDAW